MANDPLAKSLHALSNFLIGDYTLEQTLNRVAELTREAVAPVEFVGITMLVEGKKRTAIFTDEEAPEIDEAQYVSPGGGPCVTALEEERITSIESVFEDGPWPEFRHACAERGIHSTLSMPLVVNNTGVGAMNLYSTEERAFTANDVEIASQFSAQAAVVLANALVYWDARELNAHLDEAMKHRAVIEQAKGLLMERHGVDEDAAFRMLTTESQHENIKVRDLAAELVADAVGRDWSNETPNRADG